MLQSGTYEAETGMSFTTRILGRLNPANRVTVGNGALFRKKRSEFFSTLKRNQLGLVKKSDSTIKQMVVHYHIFKNAGTSVDEILKCNFGPRFTYLEGETPTSILRPDALREFIKQNENVVAISSHLLRPSLDQEPDIIPIIFLRDPLDRAYSAYTFGRRADTRVLSNAVASQTNFAGYLDWCLNNQEKGGMVIVNYQVTHLSHASFTYGHIYNAKPTEADLNVALGYLSCLPVVGLVDEFETSMKLISEVCAERGVTLNVFPVQANISPERIGSLAQRRLDFISTSGESLIIRLSKFWFLIISSQIC
jgi:Sulfotransferase family